MEDGRCSCALFPWPKTGSSPGRVLVRLLPCCSPDSEAPGESPSSPIDIALRPPNSTRTVFRLWHPPVPPTPPTPLSQSPQSLLLRHSLANSTLTYAHARVRTHGQARLPRHRIPFSAPHFDAQTISNCTLTPVLLPTAPDTWKTRSPPDVLFTTSACERLPSTFRVPASIKPTRRRLHWGLISARFSNSTTARSSSRSRIVSVNRDFPTALPSILTANNNSAHTSTQPDTMGTYPYPQSEGTSSVAVMLRPPANNASQRCLSPQSCPSARCHRARLSVALCTTPTAPAYPQLLRPPSLPFTSPASAVTGASNHSAQVPPAFATLLAATLRTFRASRAGTRAFVPVRPRPQEQASTVGRLQPLQVPRSRTVEEAVGECSLFLYQAVCQSVH